MCHIAFEKTEGRGGTVNRTDVYAESVMRKFAEFARKHLCRNLFFDKVKLCKSSTSLKTSL